MPDPLRKIGQLPALSELRRRLGAGQRTTVAGAVGSGAATVVAWLTGRVRTPLLVVCAGVEEAEEFAEDVCLFGEGLACHFPDLEVLPGDVEQPSEAILRARMAVLRHLAFGAAEPHGSAAADADLLAPGPQTRAVVSAVTALMQPTSAPEDLRQGSLTVAVGSAATPGALVEWLVDNGYMSVPQVNAPGQYCLRGGILDVYSHGSAEPVRVEFFGDEIDSVRTFNPYTQLSTGRIGQCQVTVGERRGQDEAAPPGSLLDYFAPDAPVLVIEPDYTWSRARHFYDQTERKRLLIAPEELASALDTRPGAEFRPDAEEARAADVAIECAQRDTFGPDVESALDELARISEERDETYVFCISPAEADRFERLLADMQFAGRERLILRVGRLNHGAIFPAAGLALIPHHRLFHRYRQRRMMPHAEAGRPISAVEDLEPGGLVVHVRHGIGRFIGTRVLEHNARKREHLELEFAEGVRVFVPCDRIEMVHRYIGVGAHEPELNTLRGARWRRAKRRAQQAVEDLAAELLELQAIRETQHGIAHPVDAEWMRPFESEFPYEETEDQLRAIEDVKRDMARPRPMDRLVCGDVGYGKTEVAMRAAFIAVCGGRQVGMLVPTTVLAQQHYRTFRERMADYPVNIEMLSRFRTGAETREVLEGMARGTVDIVIGTHRLLQDDVAFKDLGLVIIDEEQRFGVEHKEKLKHTRTTVDMLTLTATPIPRTLHMSLMGLREISALQTPPRDRQSIHTKVMKFDPHVLRRAVLRELNREGQVFVIHNHVRTIKDFADRVRNIVPEAEVVVAHGQMPERQLAHAMDRFVEGEADVLVSTTIVENGVDIPNANTLIVHPAEILGLAEMHQLRGRVGRYIHKAYAYFFKPHNRPVTPEAEQRLEVIQRYSQLGAGFDIALRDLEIRGAGNILGPAQSGHIAAVGYNLYCRLLARAAARMKGEPLQEPATVTLKLGLDAFLPDDYVPVPRQRMEMYRMVNQATELAGVNAAHNALQDRFGPPPEPARNLLAEARIRVLADAVGLDSIAVQDGRLHLGASNPTTAARALASAGVRARPVTAELAVIDSEFPTDSPTALAEWLCHVLRSAAGVD